MTTKPTAEVSVDELVKELRMVSNMINMGEKIRWGQETELMDRASDMLETLQTHTTALKGRVDYKEQLRDWWYSVQDLLAEKDICLHERKRVELETIVKQALHSHTTALKARNAIVKEYKDEGVMFILKVEDGKTYEASMPIPKWVEVGKVKLR